MHKVAPLCLHNVLQANSSWVFFEHFLTNLASNSSYMSLDKSGANSSDPVSLTWTQFVWPVKVLKIVKILAQLSQS